MKHIFCASDNLGETGKKVSMGTILLGRRFTTCKEKQSQNPEPIDYHNSLRSSIMYKLGMHTLSNCEQISVCLDMSVASTVSMITRRR